MPAHTLVTHPPRVHNGYVRTTQHPPMTTPVKARQDAIRAWQRYVAEHYLHALGQPDPLNLAAIKPLPFRTWAARCEQEAA